MNREYILKAYITKLMFTGLIVIFLLTEALMITAFARLAEAYPGIGAVYMWSNLFIASIPCIGGIRGYYAVKQLRSNLDGRREEATVVWLSRQFLATTIFAYAAIAANVGFLTQALHGK
jgi:hypothetical protein